MPWYPEDQIESVRAGTDIVQLIGRYVQLKRTGSGYTGLCPFHQEKTPSFHVDPSRQIYKCFGCGAGGNVITFMMEYENLSFPEALEALAEQAGIQLVSQGTGQGQRDELRLRLLEVHKKAARFFYGMLKSPQGKLGYDYLRGRGLTDETILHFGLGYAGQGGGGLYRYLRQEGFEDSVLKESGLFKMDERGVFDKFFNRVMFPIMDINNKVIGFGGRVMGDAKPKYLNSPETKIFDKSRNLFGLNYAKRGKRNQIILCEGYMDVIALHQAGFTGAVASLGTAFTEQQAMLLKRYTDEVFLTYDSDEAGVRAAMRAIPMLRRAGISSRVVHMEPYKDPDELIKGMGTEGFAQKLDEAQNSFFFEMDTVRKEYSMEDPEQKTRFVHELAKRLLVFEDKIQRENYLEAAAAQYGLHKEDLKQLVVRYGNQMPAGMAEVMQQRQDERKSNGRTSKKAAGIGYSYQLFLTWLIDDPGLYGQVCKWVRPEDFEEGLYRAVAEEIYEQLEDGEIVPARIIGHFHEAEQQNRVANMFQTSLRGEMSREEKQKALTDLVIKIREHSIDRQVASITDLTQLQKLVKEKKSLQSAVKLHIT